MQEKRIRFWQRVRWWCMFSAIASFAVFVLIRWIMIAIVFRQSLGHTVAIGELLAFCLRSHYKIPFFSAFFVLCWFLARWWARRIGDTIEGYRRERCCYQCGYDLRVQYKRSSWDPVTPATQAYSKVVKCPECGTRNYFNTWFGP